MTLQSTSDNIAEIDKRSASQQVYLGIMRDLEERRMVPGQRLIETDLAHRFGVGRNAVREAIQRLSVRGVVDVSRNKSPAIRMLDLSETMEVLDVSAVLTGLAVRAAAVRFDPAIHTDVLNDVMQALGSIDMNSELGAFSRARRRFYRTILMIGDNRELQRLFPAIGMHIVYSQFQSPKLQEVRFSDYRAIYEAIFARDVDLAKNAGREHVEHVRRIILSLAD